MKNNKKLKVKTTKATRFKKIINSDMTFGNKAKLFLKIYGKALGKAPIYLALIALSVIYIVPFFHMIGHSLMNNADLLSQNVKWLPRQIHFSNYTYALEKLEFFPYLGKTILVVLACVIGQVMSSSFVAYGLARVKFKGSSFLFGLIVFILIIPPQVIIGPAYIMFANFKWLDTFLPIIIPCFFAMGINGGLMVFIFRQFFRGMPSELENAALIDGTGIFGAYFRVIFPNAKPAILVTSILSLVWQWNNSFEPAIFIEHAKDGLLPMQLTILADKGVSVAGGIDMNLGITMAATFLCVLPLIIIFLALQGQFMKNMANSGLAN